MADVAYYAVVRSDPPEVLLADDPDTLDRLLALRLVASTSADSLGPEVVDRLRAALLEERWADALIEWMDATSMVVDVYPAQQIHADADIPADLMGARLQFSPLYFAAPPRVVPENQEPSVRMSG